MMTYIATTVDDQKMALEAPYSVQINKSRETPADSLTAVFFSQKNYPEFKFIDVFDGENQLFFSGIVDEQRFEITRNGCFLTIKSRSKAAYLIDNQASPQTYRRPSLDVIFERHIKPYGFTEIFGDKSSFNATIEVGDGMSEWDVLEQFCTSCLKAIPVVNSDGSIVVSKTNSSAKKLLFSNFENGIKYSSISRRYNRYKLISEITVCAPYAAVYIDKVADSELINKGVRRRKFISMTDEPFLKNPISVDTAAQMISAAKQKFCEIVITCPGAVHAQVGSLCQVNDNILGNMKNLTVHEVDYVLNQNGEFTVVTALEG